MRGDNIRPASWSDAGYTPTHCRHGSVYAACREPHPTPPTRPDPTRIERRSWTPTDYGSDLPAEMACYGEPEPEARAWVGAVLLLSALVLGAALGWLLRGMAS